MTLKCLIVDDEQLARDMLEGYASRIPEMEVIAKCKSGAEAQIYLSKNNIELLFLDIQMPNKTGIEFLQELNTPPKVIFTTAYSDYAVEGYALQVVDYLLKPIGFERFKKAFNKAKDLFLMEEKAQAFEDGHTFESRLILVKEGHNHHQILLKEIIFVAAMREYVQYHTSKGKLMELQSLSSVEKSLPDSHFIRIHRSYLVAKSAVKGHKQNKLLLHNDITLPLGKTYKQQVLQKLF